MTEDLPGRVTATSPQAAVDVRPPSRGLGRRRWMVLAGCALLGAGIGVSAERLTAPEAVAAATPAPSPSPTAPVKADIRPIAAAGSSFTSRGGIWQSQRYADPQFGRLKDGIGLRLDLGSARSLTSVTFTAESGPMTVELRAGDAESTNGADYELVGTPMQANGPTTLPAGAGGSHRYWVIWVTELPSSSLQAKISAPVARG